MRRRLAILIGSMITVSLLMGAINVAAVSAVKKGCTPGYWKNHEAAWGASAYGYGPYSPGQNAGSALGVPGEFGGDTMMQALWNGGGGEDALGRHAVAALLNSVTLTASGNDYELYPNQVIALVQAAFAPGSPTIEGVKNTLAGYNERGCPLN
jgi:hypothetical protein